MVDNGIGDYFVRDLEDEAVEDESDLLEAQVIVPVVVPQAPGGATTGAVDPVSPGPALAAAMPEPIVASAPGLGGAQVQVPPHDTAAEQAVLSEVPPAPALTAVGPQEPLVRETAPPVSGTSVVPALPAEPSQPGLAAAPVQTSPPLAPQEGPSREERLARALDLLMSTSGDVQAAALVSLDGFAMASALPAGMQEDRVGAMSAAILALGERAAAELGRGRLSQVFIEGADGYVLLMASGSRSVLTVLAARDAKLGLVLYDMRQAAEEIGHIVG